MELCADKIASIDAKVLWRISIQPSYCDRSFILKLWSAMGSTMISYDHYPVTGWNQPKNIPEMYHSMVEFIKLYPNNYPMVIVENADQDLAWTPKKTRGPTAQEMRAMIWMTIVAGAKGIGYFPVAFNPFRWQNIEKPVQAEMKKTNAELTALAPVLLEGDLLSSSSDNDAIKVRALKHNNSTTVILINLKNQAEKALVKVKGLSGTKGQIHGGRDVKINNGSFTVDLPAYGDKTMIIK